LCPFFSYVLPYICVLLIVFIFIPSSFYVFTLCPLVYLFTFSCITTFFLFFLLSFLPPFFASWFPSLYALSYFHFIHFCFEACVSGGLKVNIRTCTRCELPTNSSQIMSEAW
jgi:hypothetical protein